MSTPSTIKPSTVKPATVKPATGDHPILAETPDTDAAQAEAIEAEAIEAEAIQADELEVEQTLSKPYAELAQQLRAILNFDDADLQANRVGQLSEAQQNRLQQESRFTWILFFVAALLFLGVAVAAFLADIPTAALFFGGLGLFLLAGFYWSMQRGRRRLRKSKIAVIQGNAAVSSSRRRRSGGSGSRVVHAMQIDNVRLTIDRDLYLALERAIQQGQNGFTAYYLPRDEKLLTLTPGIDLVVTSTQLGEKKSQSSSKSPDYVVPDQEVRTTASAVLQAIEVLEGRRGRPPRRADQTEADAESQAQALATLQAEARSTLVLGGPAVIPKLVPLLHKTIYQEIIAEMGSDAVPTLMRILMREGHLVESRLLTHMIATLNIMPLDEIKKSLPYYLERHHPPAVRMAALRGLGNRRNPERIRILQEASQDPEPAIARHAQHTLARIAHRNGW